MGNYYEIPLILALPLFEGRDGLKHVSLSLLHTKSKPETTAKHLYLGSSPQWNELCQRPSAKGRTGRVSLSSGSHHSLAGLFSRVRREHRRLLLCIFCCLNVSPLRVHILCEVFCTEGKPAAPKGQPKLPAFP